MTLKLNWAGSFAGPFQVTAQQRRARRTLATGTGRGRLRASNPITAFTRYHGAESGRRRDGQKHMGWAETHGWGLG